MWAKGWKSYIFLLDILSNEPILTEDVIDEDELKEKFNELSLELTGIQRELAIDHITAFKKK